MKSFLVSMVFALTAAGYAADSPKPNEKPADERVPSLTEVAVVSDGETWVIIRDATWERGSKKWSENPLKYSGARMWRLPPGDYEIFARRKGFEDFKRVIHVEAGTPRITVHAICHTPR
jgi:hypothetical protein